MENHIIVCSLEVFRQPLLDLLHVGSPKTLKSEANQQTTHICFGLSDLKHFFYNSEETVQGLGDRYLLVWVQRSL